MESRKNGESAVEKNALAAGMKKGASGAPLMVTAADASAEEAADRAAWDWFVELRGYSFMY